MAPAVPIRSSRRLPASSSSVEARAATDAALWRMMSFYDPPLEDLDAAIAFDPDWSLPHAMKAGFLYSLTEPGLLAAAGRHLDDAIALAARREPTPGERAHLDALSLLREGRLHEACGIWDALLLEQPLDALALQWAHLCDFYRGDARNLRGRPARVLPAWPADDPLYPHVLALLAFGLEECHLYAAAEETGRQALALDPHSPWAIHAVAHCMEMQCRFDEGAAWLRHHLPAWIANGYAPHLWWHAALFRFEAMDAVGALRLVDAHLSGEGLLITLNRVDAAAMLWRLHLLEVEVASRCDELLRGWPASAGEAGHSAFNDFHRVLAMLGAGRVADAEAWLARCAERVMHPEPARHANHPVARDVGLPLIRAAIAYARNDPGAAEAFYAVRDRAHRFGGSHAQRDLIDQTLLAAAAPSRSSAGRAVLHERLLAKPDSPLTRHWAARFGIARAEA